jgi:hypothetical protein
LTYDCRGEREENLRGLDAEIANPDPGRKQHAEENDLQQPSIKVRKAGPPLRHRDRSRRRPDGANRGVSLSGCGHL